MPIRRLAAVVALAALPAAGATARAEAAPDPALADDDAKAVYVVGLTLWRDVSALDLSPDEVALLQRAIADAAAGRPALDMHEHADRVREFSRVRVLRRAGAERARGAAFLDGVAAEPGAVRTESGMVYRELVAGSGRSPRATDTVTVHYRGTLIDGTEFDNSHKRGEPATFGLDRVVKCWTEGLQRMRAGGKAQLVCPADLAYGDRGRPGIPPGATLVFEVELLSVGKG